MPFITETLWQRFPATGRAGASISVAPWPRSDPRARDPRALHEFGALQELVGAIRSIRSEYGVQLGQTVRAQVSRAGEAVRAAGRQLEPTLLRLARVSQLSVTAEETRDDGGGVAKAGLPGGPPGQGPVGGPFGLGQGSAPPKGGSRPPLPPP